MIVYVYYIDIIERFVCKFFLNYLLKIVRDIDFITIWYTNNIIVCKLLYYHIMLIQYFDITTYCTRNNYHYACLALEML